MNNNTNEGLIQDGRGWSNPIYGNNDWWNGESFDETNYQNVFHKISNGISVPQFALVLNQLNTVYNTYKKCSPLQAIINRIAEALMNGTWKIVDKNNDDMSETSTINAKIVNLLRKPNPLQSYSDFLKQVSLYRSIYGGAFIFASTPSGFSNVQDAEALWAFSPEEVEIRYTGRLFSATKIEDIIEKYIITPKNGIFAPFEVLNVNCVLQILDTTEPTILANGRTEGVRIKSLFYEIRNIMQAQEAIYSLNSDRGAQGIISNTAKDAMGFVPMTHEEKTSLQNRFRSNYGMRTNQDKVYVTDASVDYTPIGFNVKDLMLFEGVRDNIMHLCDSYSYPFDLLASEKGKTAADKRTAMSGLYQDTIIPLANDFSGKLTLWFGLDVQTQAIKIDYSHLEIFQQGNVERNNALRQMAQAMHVAFADEAITQQEFRRSIGLTPEIDKKGTMRSATAATSTRNDVRLTNT